MLVIRHGRVAFDKMYPHIYDSVYADSVHVKGALNPHEWWLYPRPRDGTRFIWGGSGFGGQVPVTSRRMTWSSCSTAGIFFRDGRRCRLGR